MENNKELTPSEAFISGATVDDVEYAKKTGIPIREVLAAKQRFEEERKLESLEGRIKEYKSTKSAAYWANKRRKERWFFLRFETLVQEGFTPEEANMIAYARISSKQMRRVRRSRVSFLNKSAYELSKQKGSVSLQEIREYTWKKIRETDSEIIDWDAYRRLVYR